MITIKKSIIIKFYTWKLLDEYFILLCMMNEIYSILFHYVWWMKFNLPTKGYISF